MGTGDLVVGLREYGAKVVSLMYNLLGLGAALGLNVGDLVRTPRGPQSVQSVP